MKAFRYSALLALVVLALIVAACGPSGGSSTGAQATTAPTTAAAEPTMAAEPTAAATTAAEPTMAAEPTAEATTAAEPTAAATEVMTGTATAGGTAGEMKTLEVEDGATLVFAGWGDPAEQQVWRDSVARFIEVYPNVSVDYQPIPADFQTKIKAQMAGGTGPDVLYVDEELMTALAPNNQLLPLDPYMEEAGVSAGDFLPALMTLFVQNGKTYALPKDWNTLGLIYLPEAFQAAGIPEPTADWSWQDLQTAAEAIQKTGKYGGFCMGADWARLAPFVFQNGGSYTSEDFKTATINSPEVKEAVQFIADMKESGALSTPSDMSAGWCGEALGKKLAAMTYEGGWMSNFMRTTYPDVQWKVVPLPKGPKGQADIIFTNGIGANAASKFPRAAAALALYLTGRENQEAIAKTGFAYSTIADQQNLITDPNDKAIAAGGPWPMTKVAYYGTNSGKVKDAVGKMLERIFLGDQTVEESIAQAETDINQVLSGQ